MRLAWTERAAGLRELAGLENAGSGQVDRLERRAAATPPQVDRQQWPTCGFALGTRPRAGQQARVRRLAVETAAFFNPGMRRSAFTNQRAVSDALGWQITSRLPELYREQPEPNPLGQTTEARMGMTQNRSGNALTEVLSESASAGV